MFAQPFQDEGFGLGLVLRPEGLDDKSVHRLNIAPSWQNTVVLIPEETMDNRPWTIAALALRLN
jgi:hypothetical protein